MMQLSDRLIGGIAILGGIAIIAGTFGFREIPGQEFGAAFFPRIVGSIFILIGLALIIRRTYQKSLQWPEMLKGKSAVQVVTVLLSVVAWVWLAQVVGFTIATVLLIAVQILLSGGRLLPAVLTAFAVALLLYFVFAVLLRVPLPVGVVEQLIL